MDPTPPRAPRSGLGAPAAALPPRPPTAGWLTAARAARPRKRGRQDQHRGAGASATAAANGSWSVLLAPRPATPSGAPALELKVSAPSGSFSLSNVVFGDLFLCGGQSNMAFATSQANNASAIIADSGSYPNPRLFTVANPRGSSSGAVALDVNVSTPYVWGFNASTVRGPGFGWFSAVCYLYGRDLYTALGGAVPIGLWRQRRGYGHPAVAVGRRPRRLRTQALGS